MINPTVSREVAELLKALGYPQDRWPQLVYYGLLSSKLRFIRWYWKPSDGYWLAAPTHLQAFEWLEKEKGWRYARDDGKWWYAVEAGAIAPFCAEDPDALLLLICNRLLTAQARSSEATF